MNGRPLALFAAALSGIVFGFGLAVARMTDPQKVLNFLDFAAIPRGGWDPSLAFVMAGGMAVGLIGFRLDRRLAAPFVAAAFQPPTRTAIDLPLLVGSALFGIGWGLVGLCPGPAFANLGTLAESILLFVALMLVGSWATGLILALSVKE